MSTFSGQARIVNPESSALQNDGALNLASLEREMVDALVEDKRHDRVDTMKKKAIVKSRDYDEFKAFVACAEDGLSGISRAELDELGKPQRGWETMNKANQMTTDKAKARRSRGKRRARDGSSGASGGGGKAAIGAKDGLPANMAEFDREWKRHCKTGEKRRAYLATVGPANFAALFRLEIAPALLGQVLVALGGDDAAAAPGDACLAWGEALAATGGFGLNVHFLESADEAAAVAALVGAAAAAEGAPADRVAALRKAWLLPEEQAASGGDVTADV